MAVADPGAGAQGGHTQVSYTCNRECSRYDFSCRRSGVRYPELLCVTAPTKSAPASAAKVASAALVTPQIFTLGTFAPSAAAHMVTLRIQPLRTSTGRACAGLLSLTACAHLTCAGHHAVLACQLKRLGGGRRTWKRRALSCGRKQAIDGAASEPSMGCC